MSLPTAALMLAGLAALASVVQHPSDPMGVLMAFTDAVNHHDPDRALELLHDDFVFRDADGSFEVRRAAFRPVLEWDAAVEAQGRASVAQVGGEGGGTLRVHLTEANDFLAALGIRELAHDVRYRIEDGKVREIVLLEAGRISERLASALDPVLAWARERRPAELDELTADGKPVYTGETAGRWLELLARARNAGVFDGDDR